MYIQGILTEFCLEKTLMNSHVTAISNATTYTRQTKLLKPQ